jgi:carbonic anhydrase/acetyltransferase-like protein (isoleucine patch superfamily)
MKGKYLITTDAWFYAPDGRQYRSVWGDVEIVSDAILGIKTNTRSANWFAKIGSEDNHVIIAGCQIHYACKSNDKPKTDSIDINIVDGVTKIEKKIYSVYIAE